jgi:predicted RNA binding protein YcfA (HicA-like mRNA interferase family)
MALNYALLRSLTAREMISALGRDGFVFDRGSGSHQVYCHPDGRRVSVTFSRARRYLSPKDVEEHDRKRSSLDGRRSSSPQDDPLN